MVNLREWWYEHIRPDILVIRLKKGLVKVLWHPRVYEVLAYSLCIGFVLAYLRGWNWLIPPTAVSIYFLYQEIAGDAHTWAKLRAVAKK